MSTDPVPPELKDGEVVVEAGAYEGAWAKAVCEQFPECKVHAFEPASRAYKVAAEKLAPYPNVTLYNVALGKEAGMAVLCDRNRDGANTFEWNPENEPSESVAVVDTAEMLKPLGEIAVAHLNAEGDEVAVLERMIEADLIERVRLVMTQWHPYDDELRKRIAEIARVLSETHKYERRGPWNCWIRREPIAVLLKTWQGPTQTIALKRLEALGGTISSLERNVNCPFRWYIVDDGSDEWYTDAVKEKMGERHHVFISSWADGDIGFSLNEGLRVAFGQADVVLNWSDDIVLREPMDIASYVDLLRSDERLGYVVLRPTHPTLNLAPFKSDGHTLHEVGLDSPGKFLVGTSLNLMHRRAWRVYGPWPEGLRIDLLQEEMAWRMRRFGDGPKVAIPDELVSNQGCVTYGAHSTWDWRLKDEQEKQAWYRYRNYAARFERD